MHPTPACLGESLLMQKCSQNLFCPPLRDYKENVKCQSYSRKFFIPKIIHHHWDGGPGQVWPWANLRARPAITLALALGPQGQPRSEPGNNVATRGFLSDNHPQKTPLRLYGTYKNCTSSTTAPANSFEDCPPTPTTPQKSKNLAVTTDYLEELHKEELKRWMIESKIMVSPYNKQNKDVSAPLLSLDFSLNQWEKKQTSHKDKTTT
ncbi:hypothetical protein BDZ94DRAFT_1295361 [Collybia nuda]|uniref:Uncharacterized protein n=1 Tax=Collybia nuda TaxID=64659 RepID=A0A9P5YDW3_9AGAR|nr:hypothetical protein BDZ94DRAFT_1295361 [Collybia nuda]